MSSKSFKFFTQNFVSQKYFLKLIYVFYPNILGTKKNVLDRKYFVNTNLFWTKSKVLPNWSLSIYLKLPYPDNDKTIEILRISLFVLLTLRKVYFLTCADITSFPAVVQHVCRIIYTLSTSTPARAVLAVIFAGVI